jgi:hypothetical protein
VLCKENLPAVLIHGGAARWLTLLWSHRQGY